MIGLVFHLINHFALFFKIQADVDNSGTIDYGEFIAAMLHLNKVQKEDHLYTAFSYFDKDSSGYITRDELEQACQQFGLEDVQLDDIIREVDKDNVIFSNPIVFYVSFFIFNKAKHNGCVTFSIQFKILLYFCRMDELITMSLSK